MSLMRLLTAGRSLVGLKDSPSRYRMGDPRALPKFDSKKNPFRTTTAGSEPRAAGSERPDQAAAEVEGRAAVVSEPAAPAPPRPPADRPGHPAPAPAPAGPTVPARVPTRPVRSGGVSWPGKVADKLSSLLARPRGRASARRREPAPRAPVQGELSLDQVKVMRNDLSDADLEVVPAGFCAAKPSRRVVRVAKVQEAGEMARTAGQGTASPLSRAGEP